MIRIWNHNFGVVSKGKKYYYSFTLMAEITTVEAPGKIAGLVYVNLLINSKFMIMCNAKAVNYDDKLCVSY